MEYEISVEFIEEIIPYASEFFMGVSNDTDEYGQYNMDMMNDKFWFYLIKIEYDMLVSLILNI